MEDDAPTPDPIDRDEVTPAETGGRTRPSWWRSALSGLLAAGVALAAGELVAGADKRFTSPVLSVGNRFVERVPHSLKDFAIEKFGTNDKVALLAGIYVGAAVFGLVVGILAARRFVIGAVGIAGFALVGVWAAGQEPDAAWWTGLPSVVGAVAGVAALAALLATIPAASRPALAGPVTRSAGLAPDADGGLFGRRGFLKMTGAVVVVGAGAASAGRWLQGRFSAAGSRLAVVLPKPKEAAPKVAKGVVLPEEGISEFITPNSTFYRIDINLDVPQIPTEGWSLKIKGMVDRELELSYDDLLAMDLIEERITMTCVSNEIGGKLAGNATWLGVPMQALLDRVGVQKGADQVVGRAFDDFTTGFPVDVLKDGRPAMVAVGMNGEPLPLAHGFPARMIVPGLYGMVSATKWLKEIELTTFADFDQYWVKKEDWSSKNPIKTMSRIDTPKGLTNLKPGKVAVGGVAWAQSRGITKVEVQVDDGDWAEATLAVEDSIFTWRQWSYAWDAEPGRHKLTVRATDSTGETQPQEETRPFPSGSQGWHNVVVIVGD